MWWKLTYNILTVKKVVRFLVSIIVGVGTMSMTLQSCMQDLLSVSRIPVFDVWRARADTFTSIEGIFPFVEGIGLILYKKS
jgi:hypothetical protein